MVPFNRQRLVPLAPLVRINEDPKDAMSLVVHGDVLGDAGNLGECHRKCRVDRAGGISTARAFVCAIFQHQNSLVTELVPSTVWCLSCRERRRYDLRIREFQDEITRLKMQLDSWR